MQVRSSTKGYLLAGGAVLCWSTVATAFELALVHLDVLQLLLYASLTTVVVLVITLAAQRKLSQLRRLDMRHIAHGAGLGLLNPFIYYLLLFEAYDRLPAQLAQPLNYTWPLMLTVLSIPLLRQPIRLKTIIAVSVSFCGVVIISTRGDPTSLRIDEPVGVTFALGSSLVWALYWIFNVKSRLDPVVTLLCAFSFGTLYTLVATLLVSTPVVAPWPGLAYALYVGVIEMGLTFVMWLGALRHAKTTAHVSILVYLSPFLSLLPIAYILEEPILPSTIAGLAIIVAGILIQQLVGARTRRSP